MDNTCPFPSTRRLETVDPESISRERRKVAHRRAEEERAEAFSFASDDEVGGFHARLRERL
jgi:hypothetical protein